MIHHFKKPNPSSEELIRGIDWEMLKEQKGAIIEFLQDEHIIGLEGIIHLLDAIQDCAVDYLGIDENKVFNLTKEEK